MTWMKLLKWMRWMNAWMNECRYEWMDGWMDGWMNAGMNEMRWDDLGWDGINEWMNEGKWNGMTCNESEWHGMKLMNEWMNEMIEWSDIQLNENERKTWLSIRLTSSKVSSMVYGMATWRKETTERTRYVRENERDHLVMWRMETVAVISWSW